jgi:hypothetical protein
MVTQHRTTQYQSFSDFFHRCDDFDVNVLG